MDKKNTLDTIHSERNRSINLILKSQYPNFTYTEKLIADFFLNNDEKMDFSASAMVKRLFVSKASLSRFAQKCGYKGYREFIYRYEESLCDNETGGKGDVQHILNSYHRLVSMTNDYIDQAQILRTVKIINDAKRVYVLGKGSSGHAAAEMELRFMRIGVNINAITDTDRMKMQTVFFGENDLVIGISMGARSMDVINGLKIAKQQGAKTILITMNENVLGNSYCDEVLLLPKTGTQNRENMISPQLPCLLMIDFLYLYFFEADRVTREALHNKTIRSVINQK